MAYGCFGLPDKYDKATGPCKQCMLEKAPTRDERNSKGDNNKSANEYHAGRGNGTWGANMLGDGKPKSHKTSQSHS
jgi:hypothetical protein